MQPGAGTEDGPHAQGQPGHVADVAAPLRFVGLEEPRSDPPSHHLGELPRQVGGVAHAAVHALAGEGRHQVGRVPGQPDPAPPPVVRHAGMEVIDRLADEPALRRRRVCGQKPGEPGLVQQIGVLLAGQQLEFVSSRPSRPRQGDARPARVAEDDGFRRRRRRVLEVDDQPPLVEAAAGQGKAEGLPGSAGGAVAGDHIVGANLVRRAVPPAQVETHTLGFLDRGLDPAKEAHLDRRVALQACAKLRLEHGLAEGVAAVMAVRLRGRLHLQEHVAAGRPVFGSVAGDDLAADDVEKPHLLDHAQGLVVDRHRPGLGHRAGVGLDQEDTHAGLAQQVRQHQPRRSRPDDGDSVARRR